MAWWNDGSSLANSLVAFWKCDESSGDRADSVGANTLTDNNTVTSNNGIVYSNAAEFASASSESLTITDNAALSMGDIQMFFGGWVYLTAKVGQKVAFSKSDRGANQRSYFVWYDATPDRFQAGFNSTGSGSSTLVSANGLGSPALNTWYFILAWHDSVTNTINISINGREPDTASFSTGIFDNTAPFRIGGDTISGALNAAWDGRIGPVFVGKNYIPTAQDRLNMFRDHTFQGITSWWLGNNQIPSANVLEHVMTPDIGQAYGGAAVASGQSWTVAVKSYSYLASANLARYLLDSQDGHFSAGINTNAAYGFYSGSSWSNAALFNTAQEQIWFFVSDGVNIQAYLNNVAVGSAVASTIGLHNSGSTRWGKSYDNAAAPWNNPILYGAVYDKAIGAVEREGLYYALRELDGGTNDFTTSSTWLAPSGVVLADIVCRGSGGNGGTGSGGNGSATAASGGGGGGGAYAASTDVAVTPGNTYTVTVGTAGGTAATSVVADSESVVADYGRKGGNRIDNGTGGAGGAGGAVANSTGDTKFAGGNGGSGRSNATNPTGGGGGGGAGDAANGGNGGAGSLGGTHGNAGAGGSIGGGSGAVGGTASPISSGGNGVAPGGAAGGASGISPSGPGTGSRGQVQITWVYPSVPVTISPSEGVATGETVAPTVVQGSIAIAPNPVETGSEAVTGTVSLSSIVTTPDAAEGFGEAVSDGATQDSVSFSSLAADAVGEVTGASVELGSATATAAAVAVTVRTLGGQVADSDVILAPDPVEAIGSRTSPSLEKGSVSLVPLDAEVVAEQVNPVVIKGALTILPLAVQSVATTISPVTVQGSVTWIGPAADVVGVTLGSAEIVGGGGAVLIPGPAETVGETRGPAQTSIGVLDTTSKGLLVGVWKRMR